MTKQLEQELTAWMRRQADQAPHDTDLEPGAFRKSRRIRRQRRIASAVVVAAALTIAVPTGAYVANLADGPKETQVVQTPTTTAEPRPSPKPSTVGKQTFQLDFAKLPRGITTVPWWDAKNAVIHNGDELLDLKNAPADFAQVGANGSYATLSSVNDGRSWQVDLLRPVKTIPLDSRAGYTLAAAPYRSQFAWTSGSPERTVLMAANAQTGKVLYSQGVKGKRLDVVGYLGEAVVLSGIDGNNAPPVIWKPRVKSVTAIPGALAVTATAPQRGLIAITTKLEDDPTGNGRWCSAVIAAADPKTYLWESCDLAPVAFSPDGRSLVTQPSNVDGLGARSYTIVDVATGEPRIELQADLLNRVAWESNGRAVAVEAMIGGEVGIVRCALNGGCSLVTDLAPYGDPGEREPYVLGTS